MATQQPPPFQPRGAIFGADPNARTAAGLTPLEAGLNAGTAPTLPGNYRTSGLPNPGAAAFDSSQPVTRGAGGAGASGMQYPGNNYTTPGYSEQAFMQTQDLLLNDPWQQQMQQQYQMTQNPTQGEAFMNSQLGSLSGPGQGNQYWNQVQGQFSDPFAGEQFARQATQQFGATGQANAFNSQLQSQYGDFVNFQGPQNAQGALGRSQAELGGGTAAESNMAGIAGQYGAIGQYQGGNNALGQYQQNAASGPLAGQQFYDQVAGSYGELGQYGGPNRAASQYEQTQQAFGDLPIAEFDPFFDRAIQLGTQIYNQDAAGRGVYGSSEALSGVGNIVTDLNAQRALHSFDAEMRRAQEQRARQQLLGEQARMGDLSGLDAFNANLAGLNTFGNLALGAGNQTLAQQDMLGRQARDADRTGLEAFDANLQGAQTFANINRDMGQLQLDRNRLLGDLAGQADRTALDSQGLRIQGANTLAGAAAAADAADLGRFNARTGAMLDADRMGLDRMNSGMSNALALDANQRANFDSQMQAANNAAQLGLDRNRLGADIASQGSSQDLQRLLGYNQVAQGAEGQRLGRLGQGDALMLGSQNQIQGLLAGAQEALMSGDRAEFENYFNTQMAPALEAAGWTKDQIASLSQDLQAGTRFSTMG